MYIPLQAMHTLNMHANRNDGREHHLHHHAYVGQAGNHILPSIIALDSLVVHMQLAILYQGMQLYLMDVDASTCKPNMCRLCTSGCTPLDIPGQTMQIIERTIRGIRAKEQVARELHAQVNLCCATYLAPSARPSRPLVQSTNPPQQ